MSEAPKLMQRAEECLAKGATGEAADLLAEAARVDPLDPEPPLLAAMVHLRDGRYGSAASMALQSVRVRPFHPAALNLLAVVCADAGYRAEALRILRRLGHDAPGLQRAKRNQKQIRRAKDRVDPAAGFPIDGVRELLDAPRAGLSVCVALVDGTSAAETIDSVREVADQIVVVDARSASGEPLDFEAEGVDVVRSNPTTDRAALLNESIRYAREAWVLVMKPGETLDPASRGPLAQAFDRKRTLFHEVRVSAAGDGAVLSARLFRNAPGLAYAGSVLPSIQPALAVLAKEWRLGSARSGVTLLRTTAATGETVQPDLAACCAELKQHPNHPALILQFARVATAIGDPENALEAITILDGSPFAEPEELAISRARCLMRLERWTQAREVLDAHHESHGPSRNTNYLLGVIAGSQGDAPAAARALAECAEAADRDSRVPSLPEIHSAALPNLLGSACMDLGRYDEARRWFERASGLEERNVEARMGLLSLYLVTGEFEEMLHQLDAWIDRQGDDPRVWSYGSVLLSRIPEFASVNAQWTIEAVRRFPTDRGLRNQAVAAQMACGQIDAALELLGSVEDDPAVLATKFTASLASGLELPHVPGDLREQVEANALAWLESWRTQECLEQLDRAIAGIAEARETWPGLAQRAAGWLEGIGQVDAASRIRQADPVPS